MNKKLQQLLTLASFPGDDISDELQTKAPGISDHLIGRYVIVRSRNEGINAGYLKAADDTGVILTDSRRIWYHKPADKSQCWYEGVANTGLSSDSRVSAAVSEKIIIEDYSLTACSDTGQESISTFKTHAQG